MVRNANSLTRRSHNYGTVIPRDLNYGLKCSLYMISYMCFLTLYRAKMNRNQNIWISDHLRPIVSEKHK